MSSRLIYAVSVLPVNTVVAIQNEYTAHDVIDSQIGGGLIGQATIPVGTFEVTPTAHMVRAVTLTGYTYGALTRYQNVTTAPIAFAPLADPKLLFVKNTGKLFSTTSLLGAASTAKVTITSTSTGLGKMCVLSPGEMVVIPLYGMVTDDTEVNDNTPDGFGWTAAKISLSTDAGSVAVEAVILG
jgi:hypothetical protein